MSDHKEISWIDSEGWRTVRVAPDSPDKSLFRILDDLHSLLRQYKQLDYLGYDRSEKVEDALVETINERTLNLCKSLKDPT